MNPSKEYIEEYAIRGNKNLPQLPGGELDLSLVKFSKAKPHTLKKMHNFLIHFRCTASRSRACVTANISEPLLHTWEDAYPGFIEVYRIIKESAIEDLISEARRRAFQGVLKPVGFYKGAPAALVREYSDNLIMFLIKAARPEYRDRVEGIGQGAMALQVNVTNYAGEGPGEGDKSTVDVIDVSPSPQVEG